MEKTMYYVTVVDYGDSCDGKARFLGAFHTFDDAKKYVIEDIKDTVHHACVDVVSDEDVFSVWDTNHENGSEWNIECVPLENVEG